MKRPHLLLLVTLLIAGILASCARQGIPNNNNEPAVREFLERYFSTWSAQDMDGYAECFHETARITVLTDSGGTPHTETLSDFLHGQRMAHKTATEPMRETADSMTIQADERAAVVRVPWTLLKGSQKSTGFDHFSLIKTSGGWKIIHLLFYGN